MYRVVTHTIKEEHFEHPYLAEKGMAVHTGANVGYGNTAPTMGSLRGSNADVITPCPPPNGNVIVKMPMNENWGGYEYYGEYHCWGDLMVHGTATISSDLIVEGTITGRGTVTNIVVLDTAPTGNTWAGNVGDMCRTSDFMYLCTEQDKWVRWAIQDQW